jgi:hypothetical protein
MRFAYPGGCSRHASAARSAICLSRADAFSLPMELTDVPVYGNGTASDTFSVGLPSSTQAFEADSQRLPRRHCAMCCG